jgi:hypothetical protein
LLLSSNSNRSVLNPFVISCWITGISNVPEFNELELSEVRPPQVRDDTFSRESAWRVEKRRRNFEIGISRTLGAAIRFYPEWTRVIDQLIHEYCRARIGNIWRDIIMILVRRDMCAGMKRPLLNMFKKWSDSLPFQCILFGLRRQTRSDAWLNAKQQARHWIPVVFARIFHTGWCRTDGPSTRHAAWDMELILIVTTEAALTARRCNDWHNFFELAISVDLRDHASALDHDANCSPVKGTKTEIVFFATETLL